MAAAATIGCAFRSKSPLRCARSGRGRPLGARITGTDWRTDGLLLDDAIVFAQALKTHGFDYVCVSSGGVVPDAVIKIGPGYQVPFAARVRAEAGVATRAVGLIVEPFQAETILWDGDADLVALGRALLYNPRWVWHAAETLGAPLSYPHPYERARPKVWPGAVRTHEL